MDDDFSALEERLKTTYEGSKVVFFSRGTSALYALFCALRVRNGVGEIIVPAICCESVALAAEYAGHRVVIADVDPMNACLSLAHVRSLITDETRAVVLVYVFGILVDPVPWKELAEAHGVCLVEDICQAVGGLTDTGSPVGRSGDVTLLSFAKDKIVGGDGGALVIRNPRFADGVSECGRSLPEGAIGRQLELKSLSWRNFCHGLYDLRRAESDYRPTEAFTAMTSFYRDIFVRQGRPDASKVYFGLNGLDQERFRRQERVALLTQSITLIPGVRFLRSVGDPMWWRFPFLTARDEQSTELTSRLRAAGLPVSNHYFPLNLLFGGDSLPVATDLGGRLVNLWVDDSMDESRVRLVTSVIKEFSGDSAGDARTQ